MLHRFQHKVRQTAALHRSARVGRIPLAPVASSLRFVLRSLQTLNNATIVAALLFGVLILPGAPSTVMAAPPGQPAVTDPWLTVGAALATGLAAIGAGIAVGIAGAAAIGAITEKPEVLGRVLIFVGLAEGIAIYGLIVSFMILAR